MNAPQTEDVLRELTTSQSTPPSRVVNILIQTLLRPFYGLATQLSVWPYVVVTALALLTRLPTLSNNILFIDEPAYLVQAARIDTLDRFVFAFEYRIDTKFPLGLLPYILARVLDSGRALLWVHVFGLCSVILVVVLMVTLTRKIFGSSFYGIAASILWLLYLDRNEQTMAVLLEYFQAPLIMLATTAYMSAGTGTSAVLFRVLGVPARVALTGIFLGLASLVKPPALLLLPLFMILIPLFSPERGRVYKNWLLLALGGLSPIALYVLPYLFWPEAKAQLQFSMLQLTSTYATTYTTSGVATPAAQRVAELFGLMPGVYAGLILIGFVYSMMQILPTRFRSPETMGRYLWKYQITLYASGAVLFFGYALGQAKAHYLVAVLPLLLVPSVYAAWRILAKIKMQRVRLVSIAVVILVLLAQRQVLDFYIMVLAEGKDFYYRSTGTDRAGTLAIASLIDTYSHAGDYIWVYYNAPELYWLADRRPATTEPVGSWLVDGHSEYWFQRTAAELAHDQPQVIVGLASPRYARSYAVSITDLPEISRLLHEYNCRRESEALLCLRR